MSVFYEDAAPQLCKCGCGQPTVRAQQTYKRYGVRKGQYRTFVTGHNLKTQNNRKKTPEHLRKIGEGQRRAWDTKRKRIPLGSRNHDNHGYVRIKIGRDTKGWRKEHSLVMEQAIGRPLCKGEHIHHINGVRTDNTLENLFLCSTGTNHAEAHASFDRLLSGLVADGIVRFDRATGRYYRCR